ncbi:MAG TPA: valine--tRNA ligase [Xanthobacteraceae bacterium]|jgi:valyl-tRNA synthetase|nr:valine--tRNA ligase [Xanthobacteraceae bacterium]
MIEKTYQPSTTEGRIYAAWEESGAFRAGQPARANGVPYCIVIPPPNVTGSLHMGHALNNTLQDVLCRFERMRGRDVLWQPGTDHAGIATQAVVERQLQERQQPGSREMGREAFIERVWEWKAESGGTIIGQLKRLGASCDWSRERFTMDEGLSRAVLKVFVALYNEGLIYKDKRLVNWDPKLLTAISDLEVQQVEHSGSFKWSRAAGEPLDAAALEKTLKRDPNGHLFYFHYPVEGTTFDLSDPASYVTVATTRPETMLGDTAVAIHPENEKLGHLIGKTVILPLVGRRIPIVGDDYADPEKGTGAVKITPAHDFNDFEVGKRHDLPLVNVLTRDAKMDLKSDPAFGDVSAQARAVLNAFDGADRFAARTAVVVAMDALGLVEKIEPHTNMVPHGDRSGAVVEPYLTDQWYVDAKTLAQPAIAAVREGKTRFVPQQWDATFFNWLENIQPWCISRQIWWGHQIPAWYGPTHPDQYGALPAPDHIWHKEIFVASTEEEAFEAAKKFYPADIEISISKDDSEFEAWRKNYVYGGRGPIKLRRDPDVLDTWFSSALWPFSTLGWPDKTPEVARFYPNAALVTGFDIIFFWVARMMMMGLHFMKEVPFRDVYIHRLVRDEKGAKMSKSKGNVIDPLGVIDDYSADALRFTLARAAAQGHDIKLAPQHVENNRNFTTKLWNAARFAEMNGCVRVKNFDPKSAQQMLNRWIAHETAKAAQEITAAIEAYRFNDAAASAYRFVWNVFCDWYLELAKPVLTGPDGAAKDETRAMTAWALDQILKLLHPFMPFITEELWRVTAEQGPARKSMLVLADWPALDGLEDAAAEAEIGWVVDLITAIRSVRAEMNIPPGAMIPLTLCGVSTDTRDRAGRWTDFLKRLARLSDLGFADAPPQGAMQLVVRGDVAALPLKGVIDFAAERVRLEKEIAKVEADIKRVDGKLGNADFIARAPEDVVDAEREKREEAIARRAKMRDALELLKGAA